MDCRKTFILFLACGLAFAARATYAAKPEIDCSQIRGVCIDTADKLGGKPFTDADEEQARRELGYGRRVNLNAARVWIYQNLYEEHGDQYIESVVKYVRILDECGYKCMPVLWSANLFEIQHVDLDNYEKSDAYATAVVNALKDEPGLLMFDMMNEPLNPQWRLPEEKRGEFCDKVLRFMRHEIELARKLAPDCLLTVGYTTASEIEESTAKMIDVICFHDYSQTREKIEANFNLALEWGKKLGKQVVNSEMGCVARANPYEMCLQCANERNVGWFLYELMIHGRCVDEHGIFYPNGTIRDAGTISAMFGCYRNRDLNSIVPSNANREGVVDRALAGLRAALKEYTSDAYDYRRSDKKKLLDACEVAANILEGCELVPMNDLPTAHIEAFRKDPNADLWEVRKFAYQLAKRLEEVAQIF